MATILIVDDRPINRKYLATLLEYDGHRILEATDGAEALQCARAKRPDLVVTDLVMPTMDGYELVRQLRADPATALVPVIFYTGVYHREEAENLAQSCGACRVLIKPVAAEEILRCVHELLKQHVPAPLPPVPESFDREHVQLVNATLSRKVEELERTREVAERSLTQLEAIFHSMNDGLILCDREGRIQRFNLAALIIHGFPPDFDAHRPLREFEPMFEVHDEQGNRVPFERWPVMRAVAGETFTACELRVRRLDTGYEFVASYSGTPVRDASGQAAGAVVGVRDVTEKKRAEEELQAARRSAERAKTVAEQANRAKDHFLAVLSHELRTPLTPVVMGVSMLQQRPDLDPQMRETLEIVRHNVEMEARLIDDLLDVTKIARGKIELSRSRVELCTVIHRAVEVCKPDIEARRLHFGVDLGPGAPYWVEADVSRLQQVFWNLLKNAIKFTPHGGCVGIRVRKDEGLRMKDEGASAPFIPYPSSFVMIEVNDSGIGIDPEGLSRVFNAFEQVERSITQQFGGLGLGLAISKALVEMHGGTIEAHSEGRDKGATFRIRLPLAAPAGKPAPPSPAAPPQPAVRPLRILLVEDHGVSAKMIRWVLTENGHQVETAGDVATALEWAGQQDFDLLISDLGLPDGSGHDLMRELRALGRQLPGIALSGYGQEDDIRRSYEAGFASHLTKPASREEIVAAVASVTAGIRPAVR